MRNKNAGFTLIELVMVIVILSVLGAVALPKFFNLKSDAQNAATAGIGGALASAAAVNYAVRSVSSTSGVAVAFCGNVEAALQAPLPSGYAITNSATAAVPANGSATCTVTGPNSTSATYTALGIS